MEDFRGVIRGACNACGCTQYYPHGGGTDDGGKNWKCRTCCHPPAKHQKLSAKKTCRYPGCYAALDFDLNTGEEKPWCPDHAGYNGPDVTMEVQDVEYYDDFSSPDQRTWNYQHPTGKYF